MAKPNKPKKPEIKKSHLVKARTRLEELNATIDALTEERAGLRHKMADYFLPEDEKDHGSKTTKVHGMSVTVSRKKTISCNKEQQEEFAAESPEMFEEIFPKKTVRFMDETLARKLLSDIEDFVTSKQSLPTIQFKDLESDED